MESKRISQVNELIRQELSKLIRRDIEFPKGIMATVQEIESEGNLKNATCWLSVLPEERSKEALDVIRKQSGPLQFHLNRVLQMKFVPQIRYKIDTSPTSTAHLEHLLDQVKEELNNEEE